MNVRFPPTTVPVQPPGGEPVVPIRATNPCYPARSMAYPGLRGQRVHGAAQILRAVLGIDALRDARVGVAQDARAISIIGTPARAIQVAAVWRRM